MRLAERVERAASSAAAGRGVELAIADRGSDDLLGTVILHSIDWRHERGEVGFWLAPGARRARAATEAASGCSVVNWAFNDLGLHRVEMITLPALPSFGGCWRSPSGWAFVRRGSCVSATASAAAATTRWCSPSCERTELLAGP